ncbi:FMN-binding protein [Clostridioides difficile]|uniref:FMN-binding protein n=1 Tax=Clostridioides difficile TaxID=1496 RepID=UPI000D1D8650|nr:FMN-binding protein [Clostridioides difficile]MDL5065293.1 FMN-binding protein [Clostridioides difficile]MDN9452435.1 FMN-binding protein [Clostridioides difficile]HBF7897530.1 FMN-binding protein [Clostridioides difficile]
MKIHSKATNKKKKYVKISIALFFVFICVIIVIISNLKPENLVVKDIDINNVKNGIYTGSADNKLVKATVSVEVNNGKIQNINILKHYHLLGKPAEKITTSIIKQQSLDVDAITSATYSSNTIRKAVENALRKGE